MIRMLMVLAMLWPALAQALEVQKVTENVYAIVGPKE